MFIKAVSDTVFEMINKYVDNGLCSKRREKSYSVQSTIHVILFVYTFIYKAALQLSQEIF